MALTSSSFNYVVARLHFLMSPNIKPTPFSRNEFTLISFKAKEKRHKKKIKPPIGGLKV